MTDPYAAPPQRKPLTVEEIKQAVRAEEACDSFWLNERKLIIWVARVVEHAHGIGGSAAQTQPSTCGLTDLEKQRPVRLTDEQLDALRVKRGVGARHHNVWTSAARAVEAEVLRLNGIGGREELLDLQKRIELAMASIRAAVQLDRAAMQQALEALESLDGAISALLGSLLLEPQPDAPGAMVRAAIAALRERLK